MALKPDVERVVGANRIRFIDGSEDDFDVIFYCTGYRYSFPFLHKDCRIEIVENHIAPLYKHMVNIEMPTMCFIGIPFNVCAFQMFDLQVSDFNFCKNILSYDLKPFYLFYINFLVII